MRGIWLAGDCVSSGSFIRAFLPRIRILNAATLVPNSLNSVRHESVFLPVLAYGMRALLSIEETAVATRLKMFYSLAVLSFCRVASRSKEKCVSSSVE